MEEDDPFASLIKRCQPTTSQEDILRSCHFSRESEVFPNNDDESPSLKPFGIPVDATGIIMVSLPETPKNFQTPPEGSLPAGSEEQRPPVPAVDTHSGPQETTAVKKSCTDAGRTIDLSKDSDDLGFSEGNPTLVIDGGVVLDVDSSRGVDAVVVREVFESDCISFEPAPRKRKVSDEKFEGFEPPRARIGDDAPLITGTNCIENANTEDLHLEVEEIGERLGEDKVYVELSPKETEASVEPREDDDVHKNANGGLAWKRVKDLDKFKFVGPSGINRSQKGIANVGERRELPSSISGHAKTLGVEAGSEDLEVKNRIMKGLLDALKMVAGELDDDSGEDVDFLEIAKRRGMTFPRPRWWPPEYED
ncbi:hypothetical protein U1Q18_021446 [Sarracenia purpurea var. burkii]